jgi:hypothetical protein
VLQRVRAIRVWFCVAAALVAASIADPVVELASNRGAFGAGSFTDHSSQDVLPALAAGLLFAAAYVILRTQRMLARRIVLLPALAALLPCIFIAQIVVLYAMETLEQFVVYGHTLGGTVWLGGPPLASLAAHAVSCVLTTFVLRRLTRSLARGAVRIVVCILSAIALVPRVPAVSLLHVGERPDARRRAPLLSRTGDRAPPQLAA